MGLFLLSELEKMGLNVSLGKFRDDGLAVSYATPRQNEKVYKKSICEVYTKYGLGITVEANKTVVQFLDIELNLETNTFKPFTKPNDVPLYVHKSSNHPKSILKNIPEKIFDSVAPLYQNALDKAGYDYTLKFNPEKSTTKKKSRCRKRNVLWFNPPYNSSVKTPVGKRFLKLVDKHFPKSNPLSKILNRKTIKVSYRTTSNLKQIISSHN